MIFLIFMCLMILSAFLFWIVYYIITKKKEFTDYLLLTISVIYEALYSNLVNLLAKSITCVQRGENYYSSKNYDINCTDETFVKWVVLFFIFILIYLLIYINFV